MTSHRVSDDVKKQRNLFFRLDIDGDYYRLLADGTYVIEVEKEGYETQTRRVTVHNDRHPTGAKRLDFALEATSDERLSIRQLLRKYMSKVIKSFFIVV